MLRRLVFVTQAIDADHPNLAQTIDAVRALAERCEEVVVLTDRVRRNDLQANVSFRTFGSGSRLGRGVRYPLGLLAATRTRRPDAFIAHMSPIFLILAAPVLKPLRVPMALWYTHWRATPALRLADRLSDVALTVDAASYPLRTGKARGIGHAIDVNAFSPRATEPEGPLQLLALGKTDPWKGLPLLLDAFERLIAGGVEARLAIRGPQLTPVQATHRDELAARVAASSVLRGRVSIDEPVSRDRVPELIRQAHAVVSPGGVRAGGEALDKVLFETAACAVPVVASHPSLARVLATTPVRLSFRPGDADDLAATLAGLAAATPAERIESGRVLRRWVEAEHSVEGWADRALSALAEVRAR
jgi:glycosyltransferase involved in cell wall biosynthesis